MAHYILMSRDIDGSVVAGNTAPGTPEGREALYEYRDKTVPHSDRHNSWVALVADPVITEEPHVPGEVWINRLSLVAVGFCLGLVVNMLGTTCR